LKKTITVFGSSMPLPGDEEYETAYKLGRLLAENNFNVCSGGYGGIMDAVSKGAKESGAEVTGVTVKIFKRIPSKFLTKEIKTNTLFERIDKLIEVGDGFVVLRGGTGTLVELSVVWEYMNKNIIPLKPVVCHGKMWRDLVKAIDRRMDYEGRRTGIVKYCNNLEDIISFLI